MPYPINRPTYIDGTPDSYRALTAAVIQSASEVGTRETIDLLLTQINDLVEDMAGVADREPLERD